MKTLQVVVLTIIFLFQGFYTKAQSELTSVSGKVTDKSGEELIGANVSILLPNETILRATMTNVNGEFSFDRIEEGNYKIVIEYIGFKTITKNITVTASPIQLGDFKMSEEEQQLKDAIIKGERIPVQQKDDTTQYDAGAFKTNPDANAEDLLRKMPGMDMSSGTPKAQGEEVRKILVDGKPFFGDDPTAALRNLPAEIIDKIQVYDEKSEQSQFSGFDDGNTTKTINIITRADRRQGVFGRVYAGYGYENVYNIGGNINYFEGSRRISLIGLSNNINIQNFESQDLVGVASSNSRRGGGGPGGGGGGRMGGGGASDFMVSQRNGISRTNAIGFNYSDKWLKKVDVTGSYFFNNSNNNANEDVFRQFVTERQSGQTYNQNSISNSDNFNHRVNLRLNYEIDSFNSILFIPNFSAQTNKGVSDLNGATMLNGTSELNRTLNTFNSNLEGYNTSASLMYRKRFKKRGRTFSLWNNGGFNNNLGNSDFYAENTYLDYLLNDTLDQIAHLDKYGWNINSNATFTEPISNKSGIQIQYRINYQFSESEKETYNYNRFASEYNSLDTLLSNSFNSHYTTQSGGLSYRYNDSLLNFNIGADYQYATLQNNRILPFDNSLNRTFNNFLPTARFRYKISKNRNWRMFYRTNTQSPTVEQLQDVVDNSNPLQLRMGNPKLDQSYQHTLRSMYSSANPEKSSTFFAMLRANITQDYVGNSTIIANVDTVVENVALARGTQLTQSQNMNGFLNIGAFSTYGMPIKFIKSNFNINASLGYVRTPGLINDMKNFANNTSLGGGLVLSSNISENIDFTISTNSNYNIVRNSLNTNANSNFLNQSSRLAFNYIFYKGFVFNTELNHQLFTGLSDGYNQNFVLWNLALGKKFLKNNQAEVRLSVFDVLGQNTSIVPLVTELYTQNTRSNVLTRYVMLTFSWNLRYFKGGASMKDAAPKEEDGFLPRGTQPMPHRM